MSWKFNAENKAQHHQPTTTTPVWLSCILYCLAAPVFNIYPFYRYSWGGRKNLPIDGQTHRSVRRLWRQCLQKYMYSVKNYIKPPAQESDSYVKCKQSKAKSLFIKSDKNHPLHVWHERCGLHNLLSLTYRVCINTEFNWTQQISRYSKVHTEQTL